LYYEAFEKGCVAPWCSLYAAVLVMIESKNNGWALQVRTRWVGWTQLRSKRDEHKVTSPNLPITPYLTPAIGCSEVTNKLSTTKPSTICLIAAHTSQGYGGFQRSFLNAMSLTTSRILMHFLCLPQRTGPPGTHSLASTASLFMPPCNWPLSMLANVEPHRW
jgi:hypothetical protein